MLARKYDEYAWELEEQQENTVRQTAYVKRPKQRNLKLMRRRIAVVAGILLATYFACVVRSECLISKSNELVALKQQKAALMLENSEERIVVELLKGPERITSIAEKHLGCVNTGQRLFRAQPAAERELTLKSWHLLWRKSWTALPNP